jgi:hypothetical protein
MLTEREAYAAWKDQKRIKVHGRGTCWIVIPFNKLIDIRDGEMRPYGDVAFVVQDGDNCVHVTALDSMELE